MDDALKGVRDEMARLREEMGQIRTETTQSLDSCREETHNRIAAVEMDIHDQRKDMGLVEEHVGETEEWKTKAQDVITTLIKQQSKLQEKLTDLEGRSRRNNICIWGVKEGLEGDQKIHRQTNSQGARCAWWRAATDPKSTQGTGPQTS